MSNIEYWRAYREIHRDAVREYQRAYRAAHKTTISSQRKGYYTIHKVSIIEHKRTYNELHKEKVREQRRACHLAHRETHAVSCKRYHEEHKTELAVHYRNYRETHKDTLREKRLAYHRTENGASIRRAARLRHIARKMGAVGANYTTVEMIAARCQMWGNRCYICGAPMEAIDHVKPLSKGGAHLPCNLRPVCTICNSRKRDKWPYLLEAINEQN